MDENPFLSALHRQGQREDLGAQGRRRDPGPHPQGPQGRGAFQQNSQRRGGGRQNASGDPAHMQVNILKDLGNEAYKNNRNTDAINFYSDALKMVKKTFVPVDNRTISQLYTNRSLAYSRVEEDYMALQDAVESTNVDPHWLKGYWRSVLLNKNLHNYERALETAMDGLEIAKPTGDMKVNFVIEIISLAILLHKEEFLGMCDIDSKTWSEVFKKLAEDNNYRTMKTLLEEQLDNMTDCAQALFLLDMVEYCKSHQSAIEWGQKLAIELLKRGCDYPKGAEAHTEKVLKSVLDLGIRSGTFVLLRYLLDNYDKSPARRNQQDSDGNTLLHLVAKSTQGTVGNREIALNLLLNYKIDSSIKNKEHKKAMEYLTPDSTMHKVLKDREKQKTDGDMREMQRLISEGDQHMKNRKQGKAVASYEKAAALAKDLPIQNHQHSLLHCQLSKARSEQDKQRDALRDAQRAVDLDSSCFESQRQLAKVCETLKKYDDAVSALCAAFQILKKSETERCMEDILFDMAIMSPKISGKSQSRFLNKCPAKPHIWTNVVVRLSARRSWESLRLVFLGGGQGYKKGAGGMATGCNAKRVNLGYILNDYWRCYSEWKDWVEDLLLALLEHEADPYRVSEGMFRSRHPLLTGLEVGIENVSYKLFRALAKKIKCTTYRDELGRNLLHVVAEIYHHQTKLPNLRELVTFLINEGVDPCQRDFRNYMPIHLTRSSDLLRIITEHTDKMARTKQPVATKKNQTESKADPPKSSRNQAKSAPKDKCEKCRSSYEEALDSHDYRHKESYTLCIEVIKQKSHPATKHDKWKKKCQELILKIMVERREIPGCLMSLDAESFSYFVTAAAPEHWWLVEQLLDDYGESHSTEGLAKGIQVTGFFGNTGNYHRSSPKRRYDALRKILRAGTSATERSRQNQLPLEVAVESSDWGALPALIEFGASPESLTFTEGDTPLHAALHIAMAKDPGNLDILRRLLDLHASDPEKYQYLHPCTQDKAGDTLFHVAAQGQCSRTARKAADFLFDSGVNPNLRNKSMKTALQCLPKKDDARAQAIRMAGEKFPQPAKATKEKRGKKSKAQTSAMQVDGGAGNVPQMGDKKSPKVREDIVDVKKNRAGRCRDEIRLVIDVLDIELVEDESDDDDDDDDEYEETSSDLGQSPSPDPLSGQAHLPDEEGALRSNGAEFNDGASDPGLSSGRSSPVHSDPGLSSPCRSPVPRVSDPSLSSLESTPERDGLRNGTQTDGNVIVEDMMKLENFRPELDDTCSYETCSEGSSERESSILLSPERDLPGDSVSPENDLQEDSVSSTDDLKEMNDDLLEGLAQNDVVGSVDTVEGEKGDESTAKVADVILELNGKLSSQIEDCDTLNGVESDISEEVRYDCPDESQSHVICGDVDKPPSDEPDLQLNEYANSLQNGATMSCVEDEIDALKNADASENINENLYIENAEKCSQIDGLKNADDGDEDEESLKVEGAEEVLQGKDDAIDEGVHEQKQNAEGDQLGGPPSDTEPAMIDSDDGVAEQNGDRPTEECILNETEGQLDGRPSDTEHATRDDEVEDREDDEQESSSESDTDEDVDNDEGLEDVLEVLNERFDAAVFNDLSWDMECTAEVWKILCRKDLDVSIKARVVKKMKMLGSGDHQKNLCKKLRHVPSSILLYEAKLSGGARIIWEIAIAFSSRRSDLPNIRLGDETTEVKCSGKIYAQIIRIWDIVFDHDNIRRSVVKIIGSHSRGEQCLIQKSLKGMKGKAIENWQDGKRLPMLFTEVEGVFGPMIPEDERWARFFPPASSKETEYHIMKFYSFDSNLVNNILHNQGEKLDFPFRVTELEHAIINLQPSPPCPLLLLGRSGTGKTTCCLYRLWTSFVRYWEKAEADSPLLPRKVVFVSVDDEARDSGGSDAENSEVEEESDEELELRFSSSDEEEEDQGAEVIYEHLHQIFITKNPVLCTEVNKNFKLLTHAFPQAKPHVDVENEVPPNRLQAAHPCSFPLFLTSRQFLIMLDGSLPEPYFFVRNPDGSLEKEIAGWGSEDGPLTFIPDFDDENEEEVDDEGDLDAQAGERRDPLAQEGHRQPLDLRKEVTYEVFSYQLWSIMNKKQKATCHPSLVWTEINSFIKGSMEALTSKKGYISLEEYLTLGRKRAPNFTGNREQIYELFKDYQRLIKQRGYFDEMDVIHSLYHRISTMEKPEWALHQIFVDETQDFTQAELCLLIRCCQNPNDMFLTGDTAQSIMRGVAFRFSDLKSLFYYASKSLKAMGKTGAVGIPKRVYQLTHNYRSHAGILNLASSIVDLMLRFFPESFDHLQKDKGLFDGPKPVLMEFCDYSDLAMVLRGNKRETSQIEFGAHQAILVVNDEARDNLPEELSFGLVLTIYESKGLEFDDILLYNFFKDSQAKKEWHVVRSYLDELVEANQTLQSLPTSGKRKDGGCSLKDIDIEFLNASNRPRPLDFDEEKHKILNSELKHLYTAVTRARVNIWLFDEDEEARKPMFEYFQALKLVQNVQVRDGEEDEAGMKDLFSKSSSRQEWKEQGDQFFRRHLYGVAAKCYDKSGDKKLHQLCLAHQQALEASKLTDKKSLMREKFLFVSLEYLKCEHYLEAAKCLQNAREYEFAANLFEKLKEYGRAAEMYRRIKSMDKVSRMLELGKDYGAAIRLHFEHKRYDEAIAVLRRYQKTVEGYVRRNQPVPKEIHRHQPDGHYTLRRLASCSAEQHSSLGNVKRMMEALNYLSFNDAVNFLNAHGMKEKAAELYLEHGRNVEAAKLYRTLGMMDKAIECVESFGDDSEVRSFLADLKLAHVQIQRMQNIDFKNFEQLIRGALPLYEKEENDMKAGECYLLLGSYTSGKEQEESLRKALGKFEKAKCSAGEIECLYHLVKHFPQKYTFNECEVVLTRCIAKALNLATWLNDTKGGLSIAAMEEIKKCQQFHGLQISSSSDINLELTLKGGARVLALDPAIEMEIEKTRAHRLITDDLLQKKLPVICSTARARCQKYRAQYRPCEKFQHGYDCPGNRAMPGGIPAEQRCPFMHYEHDRKTFTNLIRATLAWLEIDGSIAKAMQSDSMQKYHTILANLASGDVYESCEELIRMFYPDHHMECVMFGNTKVTFGFMKLVRNEKTIDHLIRFAEQKQRDFQNRGGYAEVLNADMYFLLHLVFLLIGKTDKLNRILRETENVNVREMPPYIISACFDNPRGQFFHVFRGIFGLLFTLYQDKNPRDAIGNCNRYFFKVAKSGQPMMIPSYMNTIMMLEYQFALSVCMYLRNSNGIPHAFLPKSYLAHITFWDAAFGGEKGQSTFSIVQAYKAEPRYLSRLFGGIWSMMYMIFGLDFKFYMFDAFKPDSPSLKNGEAERILVFALTLLINVDQMIPNIPRKDRHPYSLECLVMYEIDRLNIDDTPCSKRLKVAVHDLKKAKGHQDVAKVLRSLLWKRGEEGLLRCTWRGHDQTNQPTVHSQKLDNLDTLCKVFYNFKPADLKDSKSRETVRQELAAKTPDSEETEQVSLSYLQSMTEQRRVAEKAVKEAPVQSPQKAEEVEVDPDLTIDNTMCGTCGVRFDAKQEQAAAGTDDAVLQTEDTEESLLSRQVSSDGEPTSLDFTVNETKDQSATARQEHEMSAEHVTKVEQCRAFKDYHKSVIQPLLGEGGRLMTFRKPHYPGEELRMPHFNIERCSQDVRKACRKVRDSRDWGNASNVNSTVQALEKEVQDLKKKMETWDKEHQNMPYAQAVRGAAGVQKETVARDQHMDEEEEDDRIEPIVQGPKNSGRQNKRESYKTKQYRNKNRRYWQPPRRQ